MSTSVPYPSSVPVSGCTWKLAHRWENVEIEPHVVTAAEVRHAIVYGGRMKTAGQIRKQTELRSIQYWIEVDAMGRPSGRALEVSR